MSIVVLGSFMMDLAVHAPRVPESGETIIGNSFLRSPGGKGANQAVAMARLGSDVSMIGKLGRDLFGDEFLTLLEKEKIQHDCVLLDKELPTGVGSIILDKHGNNRIVVVPGANLNYKTEELETCAHVIKNADLLVVQLEMDIRTIVKAVDLAHQSNVPVILNPAPAQELSHELLQKVTYLTPNETETEILTGIKVIGVDEAKKAAHILHAKGVDHVVITLGEKGALLSTPTNAEHIPGYQVQPIDTVAAGDAFNGALAFGIVNGESLEDSVAFANAVGALTVTNKGAIPSLPTYGEVKEFMKVGGGKYR